MSLRSKVLSGTLWTTTSAATSGVIQILRLSILTRFLNKSDFGLVAIVVLVLGFTRIFADLGVSVSLFSKKDISKKEYSSLYWVSLLLSILLYLILLLLTPLISKFYQLPSLNELIPVMGLDLIISSIGLQFRIFREKELQFKSLALIDIFSLLLSLGVALWLAIKGAGVYSIIISSLFASASSAILLVVTGYKRHPLLLYININEGRGFYKIGAYQTGTQILDYVSSQLDILIIGKLMPISDLGVYNLVKQLVLRIYQLINPIVTKVSIPALATLQNNMEELKIKYLQMLHLIAFVNFGIYGLMALLGKEVLHIFYGPSYQNAVLILQILCIWGSLSAIGSAVSTIVIFRGRTDVGFKRTVLRVIVNPLFILIGAHYGLFGIVIGQACYSVLFFTINWELLIRRIINNISYKEYVNNILPFMGIALLNGVILYVFKFLCLESYHYIWLNVMILSFLFMTTYLLINKKSVFAVLSLIRKK